MKDPKQLLLRNVVSNWASLITGVIVAFFLSPYLVHSLGKEHYGIWALIFSIIHYSNLLDIGMKQSLARYIPRHYANRDYAKVNEVINTGNLIYGITGTLVIIMTIAVGIYFVDLFKVPSDSVNIMRIALIIIGIDQAVMFYFMAGTAIGPFHRYDVSNLIGVIATIGQALLVLAVLKLGYGIVTLAAITLGSNLIRHIVRRWYQQRLVPQLKMDLRLAKKDMAKELMNYGLFSFFIVASWMIIFNTDNIIIGLFVSTTAVTYYNIAGMLVNYLRYLVNAIGVPLVPAISHIEVLGDKKQIGDLYVKLTRYLFFITAGVCAATFMFGGKFIYIWMGPEFTQTVQIVHILILPVCIYLPQIVANSILLGIGRHKPLFYMLAAEAVLNLGLSLALIHPFGIYGVAAGTAISQLAVYTYLFPMVFHKIIESPLGRFYANSIKMMVLGTIFTVPTGLLLLRLNKIPGWTGLGIDVAVTTASILTGFWIFALSVDDRARFRKRKSDIPEAVNEASVTVETP